LISLFRLDVCPSLFLAELRQQPIYLPGFPSKLPPDEESPSLMTIARLMEQERAGNPLRTAISFRSITSSTTTENADGDAQ
jgi:hypothetical protein